MLRGVILTKYLYFIMIFVGRSIAICILYRFVAVWILALSYMIFHLLYEIYPFVVQLDCAGIFLTLLDLNLIF